MLTTRSHAQELAAAAVCDVCVGGASVVGLHLSSDVVQYHFYDLPLVAARLMSTFSL